MNAHQMAQTPIQATAPGKIILFGEHAVVYGRPAIAAPLTQVRATATVHGAEGDEVRLVAPDLAFAGVVSELARDDALALAVRQVQEAAGLQSLPPMTIEVSSRIPIAGGLGSGAAITAAITRAVARYLNLDHLLTDEWVSQLTYEVEKIHHGTPSGIDNTVVAYGRPVYFMRQEPHNLIETFTIGRPLHILVGDTGVSSSTKVVVADVRRAWQEDQARFNRLFDACGRLCIDARAAIEAGDLALVGRLMDENHAVLAEMTVSSPELDGLVAAAREGGALGAKMSGGGRGGNMIALASEATQGHVREALLEAGAVSVLRSVVQSPASPAND